MTYKVFIDDNFHYMDESERYSLGEFQTLEAAIEASKQIVDEYLLSAYYPGMDASSLSTSFLFHGEDPFIVEMPAKEGGVLFSARDYARLRCDQLCGPSQNGTDGNSQESDSERNT